jgi:UTP-glucose-1-phosphate uridylyltransferase
MIARALIPAAGRGRRAYPKTSYMAKVMLEVDGRSSSGNVLID